MNSIESIISMIESNALDHGGLQEIPEHRIGSEYRFSVPKRLRSQPSSHVLINTPLLPVLNGHAISCTCVEKIVDTSGKVWITIK